jgi:hypothetical protein
VRVVLEVDLPREIGRGEVAVFGVRTNAAVADGVSMRAVGARLVVTVSVASSVVTLPNELVATARKRDPVSLTTVVASV